MVEITDKLFDEFMEAGIAAIPSKYKNRIENVAFLVEDYPSSAQLQSVGLGPRGMLYGLYEGTPLPMRGGRTTLLPDKITIFKQPILRSSLSAEEIKEQVRHTIWHEVAHYFGLDHKQIHKLDGRH